MYLNKIYNARSYIAITMNKHNYNRNKFINKYSLMLLRIVETRYTPICSIKSMTRRGIINALPKLTTLIRNRSVLIRNLQEKLL